MKKFIYAALSAALLLSHANGALAACNSAKNQACQGECQRVYPDDDQVHQLVACARGCAIATDCQAETGV